MLAVVHQRFTTLKGLVEFRRVPPPDVLLPNAQDAELLLRNRTRLIDVGAGREAASRDCLCSTACRGVRAARYIPLIKAMALAGTRCRCRAPGTWVGRFSSLEPDFPLNTTWRATSIRSISLGRV